MTQRLAAPVNLINGGEEISWLVLEYDPGEGGGWQLNFHRALDEPPLFDNFYETCDAAQAEMLEELGVDLADWQPLDDSVDAE